MCTRPQAHPYREVSVLPTQKMAGSKKKKKNRSSLPRHDSITNSKNYRVKENRSSLPMCQYYQLKKTDGSLKTPSRSSLPRSVSTTNSKNGRQIKKKKSHSFFPTSVSSTNSKKKSSRLPLPVKPSMTKSINQRQFIKCLSFG